MWRQALPPSLRRTLATAVCFSFSIVDLVTVTRACNEVVPSHTCYCLHSEGSRQPSAPLGLQPDVAYLATSLPITGRGLGTQPAGTEHWVGPNRDRETFSSVPAFGESDITAFSPQWAQGQGTC